MTSLTPKQETFCQAYLETSSATEAYRRAYDCGRMKEASVHRMAHEALKNPKIAARIEELRAATLARHEITVDRIVQELALIGFSNMLDYVTPQADGTVYIDLSKLTREQAAAIGEVTVEEYTEGRGKHARQVKRVKFKLSDKRAALVDLGRSLGMFPTHVTGKHDHKHDHQHRAVSETARWLEGLLGAGEDRPPQKPVSH